MSHPKLILLLPLWLLMAPALAEQEREQEPVDREKLEELGEVEAGGEEGRPEEAEEAAEEAKSVEEFDVMSLLGRGELSPNQPEPDPGEAPDPKEPDPNEDLENLSPLPRVEDGEVERIDPEERIELPEGDGEIDDVILPNTKAGDGPGVVEGVVFDADGKGVGGTIVIIPELGGFKVRAGTNGDFRITGLPARGISLMLMKSAYLSKEEVVQVKPEGVTRVRIGMELKPVELAEGEYNLETREVLLDYEEESFGVVALGGGDAAGFVTGIGKEDFARQSVSTAADAIGKVSGANIVDGKYAVVRGLADRYVTTSFNNGAITSADPSRKTVQLDLFPTSVIEGIAVAKTYDASMPGDFGGGAINIQTLSMPEEPFFKVGYKIETNSNLKGEFYRNSVRELDYWGDVNNPIDRSIAFDPVTGFRGGSGNANPDPVADAAWDAIFAQTSFKGRRSRPREGESYNFAYGDRIEFGDDNRLGFVLSFSHSEGDKIQRNRVRERPGIERFWSQDDYTSDVDWSAFASARLEISDAHSVEGTFFRKRVAQDTVNFATRATYDTEGIRWGQDRLAAVSVKDGVPGVYDGFGADAYYFGEFWRNETVVRDLELFQLRGEHDFGENAPKIKWGITTNESSEARPNSSILNYGLLDFTDPRIADAASDPLKGTAQEFNDAFGLGYDDPVWEVVRADLIAQMRFGPGTEAILDGIAAGALAGAPTFDPSLGRVSTFANTDYPGDSPGAMTSEILTQQITEETTEMFTDFAMPLMWEEKRGFRIGTGIRYLDKQRTSRGQSYLLDFNDLRESELFGPDGLGVAATNDPDLIASEATDGSANGATLKDGNDREVRNFDGSASLLGVYIAGEFQWDWLTVNAGVRQEEETRGFFTLPAPFNEPNSANRSGEISETTIIPSLAVKGSFFDDRFRVGGYFSRTVARPTFFEFLPSKTIDQDTAFERRGKFDLLDTTITNFDLSLEWDVTEDSTFSITPFYKMLEDPIIAVVRREEGAITYQNALEGSLTGVEFEYDIADFKPWTLKGNYTYIRPELLAEVQVGLNLEEVSLRYPNQPEHIINVTLGYENEDSGWSSNLIYNFTGENALFLKIRESDSDVVAPAFHQLDWNLRKKMALTNCDLEVGLTVKNLLDYQTEIFFDGDDPRFENAIYDTRFPGRTFWVEGKISF